MAASIKNPVFTLRDGTHALIRMVVPEDSHFIKEGVRAMSRTSRYMRFLAGVNELTPEELRYFSEVDQVRHVAWCGTNPQQTRGYGLGRFLRQEDDPDIASFALAVIDEMQGKGLGTALMAALYLRARSLGVREMIAEVVPDNPVIPHWMPKLGATLRFDRASGLYLLRMAVLGGNEPPADNPTAGRFAEWLKRLEPIVCG